MFYTDLRVGLHEVGGWCVPPVAVSYVGLTRLEIGRERDLGTYVHTGVERGAVWRLFS